MLPPLPPTPSSSFLLSPSLALAMSTYEPLSLFHPSLLPAEQILDEEEIVALDEFAKFEARLAEKANKQDRFVPPPCPLSLTSSFLPARSSVG